MERPDGGSLHLVGLWVDPGEPRLQAGLARVQAARRERNPKMVPPAPAGVGDHPGGGGAAAGGGQVGRPHFARCWWTRGWWAARARPLAAISKRALRPTGKGAPERPGGHRPDPGGGRGSILAHPAFWSCTRGAEQLVRQLKEQGSWAWRPILRAPAGPERQLLGLAARLGWRSAGAATSTAPASPASAWGPARAPAGAGHPPGRAQAGPRRPDLALLFLPVKDDLAHQEGIDGLGLQAAVDGVLGLVADHLGEAHPHLAGAGEGLALAIHQGDGVVVVVGQTLDVPMGTSLSESSKTKG